MYSIQRRAKNCIESISQLSKVAAFSSQSIQPRYYDLDNILLPYQTDILRDPSKVSVIVKSRQIGFSWCMAFRAVYKAVANRQDTIISSYNLMSAKQVIKDCRAWSTIFNKVFYYVEETEVIDENKLNIFQLDYNNGASIYAIAGNAVNFRGKVGCDIIIDEAAYRSQPLKEILAAASANLIHGGTIRIGSTYAGKDNDFYTLVEETKLNKNSFSLHQTTFREAIEEGLYRKICIKNGDDWTAKGQQEWIDEIYNLYGVQSSQELDCIPSDYNSEGSIFDTFKYTDKFDPYGIVVRSFDLASSEKESSFYTASVKMVASYDLSEIVIVDWNAKQLNPLESDLFIKETIGNDELDAIGLIEIEPGSSGDRYFRMLQADIYDRRIDGYRPNLPKIKRIIPVANAALQGQLKILDNDHNRELAKILRKLTVEKKPLVTDLADCISNGYDYLNKSSVLGT